jgi:lysophospholipase L1-like esterase
VALRQDQADDPPLQLLRPRALAALLCAAALLTGGCGGGDGTGSGPETTTVRTGGGGEHERGGPEPLLGRGDRVLLIGDSLATVSPPTYADLLPEFAAEEGAPNVETVNLAEPGSTTGDWLPGQPLFDERLRPELAGADLVLVSVGGNDLQEAIGGDTGTEAIGGATANANAAFAAVERSGRNLGRTFAAIRRENGDARIAYVAYPDYSAATEWQQSSTTGGIVALGIGLSGLLDAARSAGPDAVVDMLAETGDRPGGVDPLLTDLEYLSPEGHRFYAERIAAELTG